MDKVFFFMLKSKQRHEKWFCNAQFRDNYIDIEAERIIKSCGYSYKKKDHANAYRITCSETAVKEEGLLFCNIESPTPYFSTIPPLLEAVLIGEVFECYR